MAQILVVDDSRTFRLVVCNMLRNAGYSVVEAGDGEEALEQLRASSESLVTLLDVVMPKLGGIGVLNAMDTDPLLAHRHAFILMTATLQAVPPQAVADLLRRYRIPLLEKPFNESALLRHVTLAEARIATQTSALSPDSIP